MDRIALSNPSSTKRHTHAVHSLTICSFRLVLVAIAVGASRRAGEPVGVCIGR